jgi:hypothetical protein
MLGEHPKTNMTAVVAILTGITSVVTSYVNQTPVDWSVVSLALAAAYGFFAAADAKKA